MRLILLFCAVTFGYSFVLPSPLSCQNARATPKRIFGRCVLAVSSEEKGESQLSVEQVKSLGYRELQKEVRLRGLDGRKDTAEMRRILLKEAVELSDDSTMNGNKNEHHGQNDHGKGITVNTNDDDIKIQLQRSPGSGGDLEETLRVTIEAGEAGKWKLAVRKLKQLSKAHEIEGSPVPHSALLSTLQSMDNEKHASESARRVIELMCSNGHQLPAELCNSLADTACYVNNVDAALAMVEAMSRSNTEITQETYVALLEALIRDTSHRSSEEGTLILRAMIVDSDITPGLSLFAKVGNLCIREESFESVFQVLSLVKASGYELDTIASAESGRAVLAAGIIAAEKLNNVPLGLRLLTAAEKADVSPSRGDTLTCQISKETFNAALVLHSKAIQNAKEENNWKLGVKILELMSARSLRPNAKTWSTVLSLCAKNEKSRKATAILFDWVQKFEAGEVEAPNLRTFNYCINVCEVCGETELTLAVLEKMKSIHETEGNVITFNIALKRLAKEGNWGGCEGIIIGMLKSQIEPSVVSYTTAIGACASASPPNPRMASEWMRRMKMRSVFPNYHTYNSVLSSCLDGTLEGCIEASRVATKFVEDAEAEIKSCALEDPNNEKERDYITTVPDKYSLNLATSLIKQLRLCWRRGDIDMEEAKRTIRVPLLKLVDFSVENVRGEMGDDDDECLEWQDRKSVV